MELATSFSVPSGHYRMDRCEWRTAQTIRKCHLSAAPPSLGRADAKIMGTGHNHGPVPWPWPR